jgi:prepilin-type N-terminal cleavage/methylation domain-containing protein
MSYGATGLRSYVAAPLRGHGATREFARLCAYFETMPRRGFSLLEALVAVSIFVVALVPVLSLLGTSSAEVVKARDRGIAVQLASSIAEWLRSQRAPDRQDLAATRAPALSHLLPVLAADRAARPDAAEAIDRLLSNFTCAARLEDTAAGSFAHVSVVWTEAGAGRRYDLTTRLEAR